MIPSADFENLSVSNAASGLVFRFIGLTNSLIRDKTASCKIFLSIKVDLSIEGIALTLTQNTDSLSCGKLVATLTILNVFSLFASATNKGGVIRKSFDFSSRLFSIHELIKKRSLLLLLTIANETCLASVG
ncbi:hypothetical protein D3C75_970560 [compost metagenome]